ncbi:MULTISPECIES: RluA family pseudouridine synthase [Dictyoglomus]|jgi:23S rRNA pseudouridine1911/1915/1917 synthase|uniref:Pseudouridine synthase n=1 Tax=Dictyoglomus turgidum (strain DSM 6724 / Z-1310) TaxID=515635 RepID=B8E0R4_DICTD|nr:MULTISPECIES: RluA family pseudouridine synthase [Dictyoglomus]ACK43084.1 pseudouridine synthase, RluA family [Dictyoglomus turgidum DSM 6724]PNV79261.1 MAG: RluA family pseudouridine synthase [Dictyoglomus turgidum]HBU31655.1 RluA family pseudouridine synthase [Dictyoglomus sp.]
MEKQRYEIYVEGESERIDKYLSKKVPLSRSQIQDLIEKELIKVNEKPIKNSYKVKLGDRIEVIIPPPVETEVKPQDIPIEIVYEDEDMVIINKPKGMVVHPAHGHYNDTLVNALLYRVKDLSGIGGELRPGIIHRLDKDTTGLLIIAKNDLSHQKLSEQLKNRTLRRTYWALCEGEIPWEEKRIEAPIGRHPINRKKMAIVPYGKIAITNFKVLERFKGYTLISADLETGRTHQIRVHISHLGFPIVGDEVYGRIDKKFGVKGQLLHAKKVSFIHPTKGIPMEFEIDLPEEFKKVLTLLREKR